MVQRKPIRLGFLGGGMMAQVGHLPFYLDDKRVEVVAVAEERPSLQRALADRLGQKRVVASHNALLARSDIDAVVICAPRPATGPLTLQALQSGKHVLAEKPMAHTVEQARKLVETARTNKLLYEIGFMKLFDPGVQVAKRQLLQLRNDGTLGRLLSARFFDFSASYAVAPPAHVRPQESREIRYPTWPTHPAWLAEQYRGTYEWFLNAASHDVSLLRCFFPGTVTVIGADSPNDGAISAVLRCDRVALTLEIAKTSAGHWIEGAEFLFERGRLALTIPSPMASDSVGSVTLDDPARGLAGHLLATENGWCFARQAAAFIDTLLGCGNTDAAGEQGLADLMLIENIWRRIQE